MKGWGNREMNVVRDAWQEKRSWRNKWSHRDRNGRADTEGWMYRVIQTDGKNDESMVERGMKLCLVCQKRKRYDRKQPTRVWEKDRLIWREAWWEDAGSKISGGMDKRGNAIEMRSTFSGEESDERTGGRRQRWRSACSLKKSCFAFFSRWAGLTKQIKSVLRAPMLLRDAASHCT